MGGYALWQVVEIELFRMRNAECTRQNGKWILNSTFLILHLERGCSSVGRAVALQAIGQEFESPQLHQLRFQISDLKFQIAGDARCGRVAQLVRACA